MSLCKPTTPTRLNVIITSYVLLLTISSVLVNLAQLVVGEAVRKGKSEQITIDTSRRPAKGGLRLRVKTVAAKGEQSS